MLTQKIQGIPYVPGCTQGELQRHIESCQEQEILLLSHDEKPSANGCRSAGMIVVDGAPYSHKMIQFLGLGIPTVIINSQQAKQLPQGGYFLLNGSTGEINAANPAKPLQYQSPPTPTAGKSVATADGVEVYLNASISGSAAASRALNSGATAIGLVRTELLQPSGNRVPNAAFYRQAFTDIGVRASPLTLTFRLLDLAPDKIPPWLPALPGMQGPLGLQGMRLYQSPSIREVVFAQLAALNALTSSFNIQLLIPFVTSWQEFQHWRDMVNSLISAPVTVGAMLETPAAVLDIGKWLKHTDLISIGCNDLMQCLFAADRDLPQLRHYLNPYAPALLRFLQQTALMAGEEIIRVQLCGLLPQWPGIMPLLVGMGYRRFSVEPAKIPYLAQSLNLIHAGKMQRMISRVCDASSPKEAGKHLGIQLPPVWSEA